MAITTGAGLGQGLSFVEQAAFLFSRLQPVSCALQVTTVYQTIASELNIPYVSGLSAGHSGC